MLPADEIKNNNQVRTLAINFDKGTQEIEISGTQIVPEFGNIAIITMIFAMAIVALIVTGSKYNKGLSSFYAEVINEKSISWQCFGCNFINI